METNTFTIPPSTTTIDYLIFIGISGKINSLIELSLNDDIPFKYHATTSAEETLDWLNEERSVDSNSRIAIIFSAKWLDDNRLRLLKQLHQDPDFKYIPVLVISDRIHWSLGHSYIESGSDDYFNTPIGLPKLLAALDYHWTNKAGALDCAAHLSPASVESGDYAAKYSKRALDIIGSCLAILIFSPVMLLTALAIRLESEGPVLYRSKRIGAGFKSFDFWKFRSMYINADQRLEEMKQLNQYGSEATFVKISNDPRVTKVGRFIRKYSIDELPQLFNVLKGDMSLVGNRPLPVYEADQLGNEVSSPRFFAPAGLTGLWQVSKRGHSDMSTEERIELDVKYAEKRTFWFDIKILCKTITSFVQRENV